MAASGMDWMIDAVMKSAGFDPVEARQMISQFVEQYIEQDKRLKNIEAMQRLLLKQNAAIAAALNVEIEHHGDGNHKDGSDGNGIKIASHG